MFIREMLIGRKKVIDIHGECGCIPKRVKHVFLATDVDQGKTWDIQPLNYVTPDQLERMLFWNDMLVPFCQHVAESLKSNEGRAHVEVRGRVACSLHGRRPELLIEPELDLAAQRAALRPVPWYRERTYPLSDRRNPGDFLAILYPESERQNLWRGFPRGSYVLWREIISVTNKTPRQTVQKIEIQATDQERPTLRLINAVDGTLVGPGLLDSSQPWFDTRTIVDEGERFS